MVRIYGEAFDFFRFLYYFSNDIWVILLLKMCGFNNGMNILNSPSWNISALLIVEVIFTSMLINFEKLLKSFIIPVSLLIGFGYWSNYGVPGSAPYTWIGFTTFGIIRVWLCFCLAFYSYKLTIKLSKLNFTTFGKILLSIFELFIYIIILLIMQYGFSRDFMFLIIFLFAIVLPISISKKSYVVKRISNNFVTLYLGRLSLSIFLVHHSILIFFKKNFLYSQLDFGYYFLVVFLFSNFFLIGVDFLNGISKKIYKYFVLKILSLKM